MGDPKYPDPKYPDPKYPDPKYPSQIISLACGVLPFIFGGAL
jgi:hypothetical protein